MELLVKRGDKAKKYGFFGPKLPGDVGLDLTCVEDTVVPPGDGLSPTIIPVDVQVRFPEGIFGLIFPRSSTNIHSPLRICQAPIDTGYTGPLDIFVRNVGTEPVTVPAGTAIAQLVLFPVIMPTIVETDSLPPTERGGGDSVRPTTNRRNNLADAAGLMRPAAFLLISPLLITPVFK